ncbi:acetylajmalan esterase-like [Coffea arabica]|uniref:Acetylajmalan esterase-like n=1 Tax=Coffea arabica TaxID=13443 RepID=A0ABM4UY04_COFAR
MKFHCEKVLQKVQTFPILQTTLTDSASDTGNLIRVPRVGPTLAAAHPPYGETFPGRPTGRWSDGRLIIDYIAMELGLPLLNPNLNSNASFNNGVNFSVAGATALNTSFLAARGVFVPAIFTPLSGQLDWLRRYLHSLCSTPSGDAQSPLALSLLAPYTWPWHIMLRGYVYLVSHTPHIFPRTYDLSFYFCICGAIQEIIRLGATKIVVPGAFPLGCLPSNLVLFPNDAKDGQGCLRNINELSIYFNNLLKKALNLLRLEFPSVIIIYADYYTAFEYFLAMDPPLACCGIGGQYNFDRNRSCGSAGVPVCPDPRQYIQWDGDR